MALPVFKIGRSPLSGGAGFDSQALPPFPHINRLDTTLLYSRSLLFLTHGAFYTIKAILEWALRGRLIMNIGVHNFDLSTEESGDAS
ncbi:MAG: hypothetical protein CL488_03790 [Acidobacteria bacterium]|nr:hypothetical protein [Acidobacteriota bacterium]